MVEFGRRERGGELLKQVRLKCPCVLLAIVGGLILSGVLLVD